MKNLEDLINAIINESILREKTYTYLILGTKNSFTSGYFTIDNNEASYDGDITIALFNKYVSEIETFMQGQGVLCIKVDAGILAEHCLVKDMNPELFDMDVFELLNYQRYGLEPMERERKDVLQKSLRAEKIKITLVFACYMNDMDRIRELVFRAKKSDLDKILEYRGTPLQFCSMHNNVEAFRLLAERGANIGKRALTQTPLEIAFKYSSDIVNYIHSEYPDIYEKEVIKKGFNIALHCQDVVLLEDILKLGCDMDQERKPFPPLHNFADTNNVIGIKFLLDRGANIECRNQYKQTALHRAIKARNTAAVQMLLKYGADIYAKDNEGKTALDLAETCENEDILHFIEK
ncbi:ankyrin repeat domain-containing protein [Lysinibacillus sp. G4S2]|uniref:ankyrin repeat domain-containing protein n=1 Tax=Lysinibacillus sp. G4S2 TaxID=3055859 RepID=UPI0025A0028A|nr:ankyrin repeat domain-containing protein [Lysinibacillus sp. G4S2]MDM5248385.1 ankyrin repeat domain-containing protein [Lysinibacillus sp. G4S2]